MVRRIADDLRRAGQRVFTDTDAIPGQDWQSWIKGRMEEAGHILVILSPAYVGSDHARHELAIATLLESEGKSRIIPVLIADAEPPYVIRAKRYVDLRQDYDAGLALILKAIKAPRQVPEELRAQRRTRTLEFSKVLVSLVGSSLAAAASALGGFASLARWSSSALYIVLTAVGLTLLVALIVRLRSGHQPAPIKIVTQVVDRAFCDALERSSLNPRRGQEENHG
jgi:hypothetical protein